MPRIPPPSKTSPLLISIHLYQSSGREQVKAGFLYLCIACFAQCIRVYFQLPAVELFQSGRFLLKRLFRIYPVGLVVQQNNGSILFKAAVYNALDDDIFTVFPHLQVERQLPSQLSGLIGSDAPFSHIRFKKFYQFSVINGFCLILKENALFNIIGCGFPQIWLPLRSSSA